VIGQEMAGNGLKVLSYAYKDVSLDTFHQLMSNYKVESPEFREEIENDLIYVATFGLDDPLRDRIEESV